MHSIHVYFQKNWAILLSLIVLLFIARLIEFFGVDFIGESEPTLFHLLHGIGLDLIGSIFLFWISFLVQFLLYKIHINHNLIFPFFSYLFVYFTVLFVYFFYKAKAPLDETIYSFTWEEIKTISGSFSEQFIPLIGSFLVVFIFFIVSIFSFKKWQYTFSIHPKKILFSLFLLLFIPFQYHPSNSITEEVYTNNKIIFFGARTFHYFNEKNKGQALNSHLQPEDFEELDEHFFAQKPMNKLYPLLHQPKKDTTFASKFTLDSSKLPNIVYLIVEGLSSDFIGNYANSTGNIMPFLDSLKNDALYFPHFLSTCQRTFNVLPATIASVPNSTDGLFTMNNTFTPQISLQMLLNQHYFTRFYCGVDLSFCNMNGYMSSLKTQYLVENWSKKYDKPFSERRNTWGYPDDRLYQKSWEDYANQHLNNKPRFDVFLTISSHDPFVFPKENYYLSQVKKRLKKNKKIHATLKENPLLMASYLYADDALKSYFEQAKKHPDFKNTIFFIFGDHGNPGYARNELSKFHTPLVIYSPLLKHPETNLAINTHLDLAPSILSLFQKNQSIHPPAELPFLGKNFSFSSTFQSKRSMAFLGISGKNDYILHENKIVLNDKLYQLNKGLELSEIQDDKLKSTLKKQLKHYDIMSKYCFSKNRIIPEIQFTDILENQPEIDNYYAGNFVFIKQSETQTPIESDAEFINFDTFFPLKKSVKRLRIQCEIAHFLTSQDEVRALPRIVASLSNEASNEQLFWQNSDPALLKNPFKKNAYNTLVYLLDVNVPKDKKIGSKNELRYYFYNPRRVKMKFNRTKIKFYTVN